MGNSCFLLGIATNFRRVSESRARTSRSRVHVTVLQTLQQHGLPVHIGDGDANVARPFVKDESEHVGVVQTSRPSAGVFLRTCRGSLQGLAFVPEAAGKKPKFFLIHRCIITAVDEFFSSISNLERSMNPVHALRTLSVVATQLHERREFELCQCLSATSMTQQRRQDDVTRRTSRHVHRSQVPVVGRSRGSVGSPVAKAAPLPPRLPARALPTSTFRPPHPPFSGIHKQVKILQCIFT